MTTVLSQKVEPIHSRGCLLDELGEKQRFTRNDAKRMQKAVTTKFSSVVSKIHECVLVLLLEHLCLVRQQMRDSEAVFLVLLYFCDEVFELSF